MKFDREGDIPWQLDRMLNRGLDFQDNIRGGFVEFTSTGEGQDIRHNLGFTPVGFLVILKTGDIDVWATETQLRQWNGETISLSTNVPNVTVRLYVM